MYKNNLFIRGAFKLLYYHLEKEIPDKESRFFKFFYEIKMCNKCANSNKLIIFNPYGKINSKIMIIKDPLIFYPDNYTKKFIFDLYKKMLNAIDIDISDVYTTFSVKCSFKNSLVEKNKYLQIQNCKSVLMNEINLIRPSFILAFGKVSSNILFQNEDIKTLRQNILKFIGIPTVVTYHPVDFLIENALKKNVWHDLLLFKKLLNSKGL